MSSVKVLNESVISLIEARELLPFPVSLSTVKHWVRVGFRGIVLESARIGWRRVTSRESVARFLHRVNSLEEQAAPAQSIPEPAAAIA